jgi:uncharacterized damage-inducible protein DinB
MNAHSSPVPKEAFPMAHKPHADFQGPETGEAPHPGIAGCLEAFGRCRTLIAQLTPEQFAYPIPGYNSIGAHLRHCVDHLTALLRGLETGLADYDSRERDPRLEQFPERLLAVMDACLAQIAMIDPEAFERPLRLRTLPAPGGEPIVVHTSLARELSFLANHTIHHLAAVRLLAGRIGVEIPESLDVAYSTAAWRAQTSAGS